MLLQLLALAGWIVLAGNASQYAPGVMSSVINNRQAGLTAHHLPARLPAVHGYVAVEDCTRIGEVWYLRAPGRAWETFLVVDCAQPTARRWMREHNILVEVDHLTAARWNVVGKGVRVQLIRRRP